MNVRNAAWRRLAWAGSVGMLAMSISACAGRADDINRVQPGYMKKAIFQQDSEWYYNRTIVKSDVSNSIAWEGMGVSFALEKVKWRIEEDTLYAYRAYEVVPGSETGTYEGKGEFEGAAIGAWPIQGHFDIIRGYDTLTGQETNIINENAVDRAWSDRAYMRVDWASNLIESGDYAASSVSWLVNAISTGKQWTNLQTKPTDPYASRFSNDYIEVTEQAFLAMDIFTCAEFTGFSGAGYQNCGYGEAQLRHSFKRIVEPSDYIPREYPDSIPRVDPTTGQEIVDEATGEVERELIFDRFGYFRSERLTYDRGYGHTETGRLFRAQIFNLWEKHTNEAGEPLPYAQRTPKPVIYYTNYDYPERWRTAANEVAADYDRVFSSMVADKMGISTEQLASQYGPMFEIRPNDCNAANIRSTVSNNPDLRFAVERAVCGSEPCTGDPLDMIGVGNLAQVCTSLEAATLDADTGVPGFEWQRLGDVRYSFVAYMPTAQMSPWGGYGPAFPDPHTGESIAATAWIRGMWYEMVAAGILDIVDVMNDKKSISEVIYGQDIRRHINDTVDRALTMTSQKASPQFIDRIQNRMNALGTNQKDLLREVDPNWQMNRIKRIEGTRAEQDVLMDPLWSKLHAGPQWDSKNANGLPEELMADAEYMATPRGIVEAGTPLAPRRMNAIRKLSAAGYCFLRQDVDPYYESLAALVQDMDRDEAYEFIVNGLIKHVMLHELGHNVGLRHNFESSYDALNYYPEFWQHYESDEATKLANHWDVRRATSVMEYAPSKHRVFGTRLGPYDEAALRFGYVNQVHTFADASITGGRDLYNWRILNDYKDLPQSPLVCPNGCTQTEGIQKLTNRVWVDFDPQNPPANEVPYAFCSDEYAYRTPTPFCATGDYGSSVKEIFADKYVGWSGYFPFNNFSRQRLSPAAWSPTRALMPAMNALSYATRVGQWLYYWTAVNRDFVNESLGNDMAVAVAQGLNMAAEIISTPEPIRYCDGGDGVFIPHYFFIGCDEYAPIDSQYAIDSGMMAVPIGAGRPVSLGFSEDYVDWQWEFVGSFFDKSNALWLLGMYQPTFFRFDYNLDVRTYFISLFRLFEPELRGFYENLILTNTNLIFFSDINEVAEELGSYWCRDDAAPGVASAGRYEPRRLIDVELGTTLPGPTAECNNPMPIYPRTLNNLPFNAMFWAHALFSNPFDSELDMGKAMKVYVVGADDEFVDWRSLPATEICSITHLWTGLEYRAVRQPGPASDIGCLLIEKATSAQELYEQDQGNDFLHRVWQEWMERLEFARDLSRIYDR